MENLEQPQRPTQAKVEGPGRRLAAARAKLGLEVENVAEMLHLSVHQIRALEGNDYAALPEPTYIRGYLRNYCQLLGVDHAPYVEAYTRSSGTWKAATYSGLAAEQQVTSQDHIVRLGTYGVAAVVLGLVLAWWFSAGEDAPPAPVTAQVEMAATPPAPAAITPPESATTAPGAGVAPADQPQTVTPDIIEAPKTPSAAEAYAPAATETPGGTRAKVVLYARTASWADIRDVHGTRLLYESVAAGRTVTLEGVGPFKVFLGNGKGVDLTVNGLPYDFSAHLRGMTARFSIDTEVSDQ